MNLLDCCAVIWQVFKHTEADDVVHGLAQEWKPVYVRSAEVHLGVVGEAAARKFQHAWRNINADNREIAGSQFRNLPTCRTTHVQDPPTLPGKH